MSFELVRYSQRDPQWKDKKLGSSNLTLGYFGCAVSSVAMLLSGHGYKETPDTLNEKLKKSGGFMGAAIVWAAVSNIYPKVRFKNLVICRDNDAPIDAIGDAVRAGQPVLLEVDYSPQSGLQTHWVVAYEKVGKDFLILDPYPYPTEEGQNVSLVQRYSHGKELKRSITAVVWYDVQPANVQPPAPEPLDPSAFYLQVADGLASPGLRLRSQPTTASETLAYEESGTRLRVLETENVARPKVGIFNQWIRVRDPNGLEGYVAAWFIDFMAATPTPAPVEEPTPDEQPTLPSAPPVTTIQRVKKSVGDGLEQVALPAAEANKLTPKPSIDSPTHRLAADIWNRFGGLLEALSKVLAIEPAVAVATLAVESGGQAFGPDGKMLIRFENHVFYNQWGKSNQAKFAQHFTYNSGQPWTGHKWRPSPSEAWRPTALTDFHGSQSREWEVFTFATSLNDSAAKMSISMGAPQIMGFNFGLIGFASVQDMFNAFSAGERDQIIGFFDFIQYVSPNAVKALQSRDFKTFATYYNGSGQAVMYGNLIKTSYDAFNQLRADQPAAKPPQPEPVPTTPAEPEPTPVEPTPVTPSEPTPVEPEPVLPPPPQEKEKIYVSVLRSVGSSGLRMRKQASQAGRLVTVLPAGSSLRVLDDPDIARPKIGKTGAWLWVRDRQDREGYVAAWFVELDKSKSEVNDAPVSFDISDFTEVEPEPFIVHVSSLAKPYGGLRLRQGASEKAPTIKKLAIDTPLTVIGDQATAEARIGKYNMWLRVKEPLGDEGYVAAWFVAK